MSAYPFYSNPPWAWGPMAPGCGPEQGPIHPHHGSHHHGGHQPHYHGFCHSCCHPISQCVCGCRDCRKEAKELLVAAKEQGKEAAAHKVVSFLRMAGAPAANETAPSDLEAGILKARAAFESPELMAAIEQQKVGTGAAFIGGGCCVHLSVEYTMPGKGSAVVVMVTDSEGTVLAWGKLGSTSGYFIKEDISTTNPGATLQVAVVDAVARVRWCEVFSC